MDIELTNLIKYSCDEDALVSLANFALDEMGINSESEMGISLVDEEEMSSLHLKWMNESGPTDVLSFPMDEMKPFSKSEGPGIIGDIVLCPSFAENQAKTAGHSAQAELELLTMHGVLHLLGYDHEELAEEKEMFSLQEKYLSKWRSFR